MRKLVFPSSQLHIPLTVMMLNRLVLLGLLTTAWASNDQSVTMLKSLAEHGVDTNQLSKGIDTFGKTCIAAVSHISAAHDDQHANTL